jgi:hypothetical protein
MWTYRPSDGRKFWPRHWASPTRGDRPEKDDSMFYRPMSYRTVISFAAAVILAVACVSTDALAYRGGARGVGRVGGYHGGYHGGYGRGGWGGVGVGLGAAAIGAAVAAPYYYNSARCGYYPYPACY